MHYLLRVSLLSLILGMGVAACGQDKKDPPKAPAIKEDVKKKIEAALPQEAIAKPKQARKILLYSKTLGFRHGSIPVGAAALTMLGEKTGAFSAVHSEDPEMFDENRLSQFDAVFFVNTTGDCLAPRTGNLSKDEQATLEQRKKNLLKFIADGKGFGGLHSATDTFYSWKEYGDLIGAYFTSHPWYDIPVKVDSANHPLTKMFDASGFRYKDEIYMFGPQTRSVDKGRQPYSRDRIKVLLSIDASKFDAKGGTRPDKDYAISWVKEHGKGRVFYCALGHNDFVYWDPQVMKHYLAGIQYILGDLSADATPSAKP